MIKEYLIILPVSAVGAFLVLAAYLLLETPNVVAMIGG